MGKCIAYTAGAITCMGIGALVCGLSLYFVYPDMRHDMDSQDLDDAPRSAKCQLEPSGTFTASGDIYFSQNGSSNIVEIVGIVEGLSDGPHGFHIHEFGVMGGACADAKSHYNPEDEPHGGPNSAHRHIGDLGNIQSVGRSAKVEIEDDLVTLYGELSVLGRAIVIHDGEDDLGESGDSAGAAGTRVTCCTIFVVPNKGE